MKQLWRFVALVLVAASMATLAGCTSKITEEQLAKMRDLRAREQTLRQQLTTAKSNRDRLQSEINQRRSELDQCSKDREFVQSKLAQWPNVWPDWQYVPEGGGNTSTPRR